DPQGSPARSLSGRRESTRFRACHHCAMEKAPDPAAQTWLRIQDGTLRAEDVPLTTVADAYGTPAYVYSRTAIESAYREIDAAISFAPRRMIAYAVKANGNLSVLNTLARLGSGVEVVSGGELARALR